ncbi:uncharacterized protein ACJ7VT_001113 isoform 2-T2 [Polymixia lowei]
MSSGGAVLVHCAAGISRSPALAVAYIMYSLGMDLDHAYRFVKERRPSISPNFNFLGQLQHFQGTLSQKASDGSLIIQPLKSPNACLQSINDNISHSPTELSAANQSMDYQGNHVTNDFAKVEEVHSENVYNTDKAEQRYSHPSEIGNPQPEQRNPSALTLSLSGKLRTLNLTLNQNQRENQTQREAPSLSPCEPAKPTPKPTQLQLPIGNSSLLDKRKNLTLSLSPLGAAPAMDKQATPKTKSNTATSEQTSCTGNSKSVHKRDMGAECQAKSSSNKPTDGVFNQREWSSSRTKYARPTHSSPKNRLKGEREGRPQGKKTTSCPHSAGKKYEANLAQKTGRDLSRGKTDSQHSTIVDQQPMAETQLASSAVEPEESLVEDQGLLSPLNLTVNKLLGWGEKILLGVLLSPRIKMGQAALPYRC